MLVAKFNKLIKRVTEDQNTDKLIHVTMFAYSYQDSKSKDVTVTITTEYLFSTSTTTSTTLICAICKNRLDAKATDECSEEMKKIFNYESICLFGEVNVSDISSKDRKIIDIMLGASEMLNHAGTNYSILGNCIDGQTYHYAILCKDPILKELGIQYMGRPRYYAFMTIAYPIEYITLPFKIISVGIVFLCPCKPTI